MNTNISRREFLGYSAMTAVGVVAAACRPPAATPEPTAAPTAAQVATSAPQATAAPATEVPAAPPETDSLDLPWPWTAEDVADTSDLPTWTGKQLKLRYWYCHGTEMAKVETSVQDVVSPEVARVAGITIDDENSFGNGGQHGDVKLGMLAAANDWPHLIVLPTNISGGIKQLAEAGKVYDLTDLIPQYMPTMMKKTVPAQEGWAKSEQITYEGRIYTVPFGLAGAPLPDMDPTVDSIKYAVFAPPPDYLTGRPIWVRDDILRKLYPQAKTQQEIVDLYMEKGPFSKEDVFDVPIKSAEDFFQFLHDIKALGIKEGGREVSPFYVSCGLDNWPLMVYLGAWLFGRCDDNYFCYWDNETKRIEFTFKQPFFREELQRWNQLVRDGVAAKESLIDTNAIFTEKLNQGLYATSYAWLAPDNKLLEQQGKPYRYRKVYLDIPQQKRFNFYAAFPGTSWTIGIFKDKVSEQELIQILRWLDYMASDAGEKLSCWGPRSAGLWEERDGKRVFTDQDLEAHMVYNEPNGAGLRYNMNNGFAGDRATANGGIMPALLWGNRSKFHPAVTYDRKRSPGEAELFFAAGMVVPPAKKAVLSRNPAFWVFPSRVPGAERAWKARQSYEDALLKTLTATNDAEFEKLYGAFLTLAESIGYTDETLEEMNRVFREDINPEYMDNLLAAGG